MVTGPMPDYDTLWNAAYEHALDQEISDEHAIAIANKTAGSVYAEGRPKPPITSEHQMAIMAGRYSDSPPGSNVDLEKLYPGPGGANLNEFYSDPDTGTLLSPTEQTSADFMRKYWYYRGHPQYVPEGYRNPDGTLNLPPVVPTEETTEEPFDFEKELLKMLQDQQNTPLGVVDPETGSKPSSRLNDIELLWMKTGYKPLGGLKNLPRDQIIEILEFRYDILSKQGEQNYGYQKKFQPGYLKQRRGMGVQKQWKARKRSY